MKMTKRERNFPSSIPRRRLKYRFRKRQDFPSQENRFAFFLGTRPQRKCIAFSLVPFKKGMQGLRHHWNRSNRPWTRFRHPWKMLSHFPRDQHERKAL